MNRLSFKVNTENSTRVAMLKRGETDIAFAYVAPDFVRRYSLASLR